jgi:transketolase
VRARVAIEASAADWWRKYVGLDGAVLGMESFGASAPGKVVFEKFGFTVPHVLELAEQVIGGTNR